jgi:antitoxin component YwqK of YwqJK toxin-antitoxin module
MKFFSFVLLLSSINSFSQSDSICDNLDTVNFYLINEIHPGNTYKINGQIVGKEEQLKFVERNEAIWTCCPCVLKSFSSEGYQVKQRVCCPNMNVGWQKEYFPNGNLKFAGQFKENPQRNQRTGDMVKNGKWQYYSIAGDTAWTELWDNGTFLRQIPEQKVSEIWKVDVTLEGISVDTLEVPLHLINKLKFTPKFKNSNHASNLSLSIRVIAVGFKQIEGTYTLSEFKMLDFKSLIENEGIKEGTLISFDLSILDNDKWIQRVWLSIQNYS